MRYIDTVQRIAELNSDGARQAEMHKALDLLDTEGLHRLALRALRDGVETARRASTLTAEKRAQGVGELERKARQTARRDGTQRHRRADHEAHAAGFGSALAHAVAETNRAIDSFVSDIRMEWTMELLHSDFALRNGNRVTWGEATVEQHTERRSMFADNAKANLAGAARHDIAITSLTNTGALNLNGLVAGQEAAA